ncbi:MAG: hypothetical protein LQ343_005450 [Gyalolechia ehrenbergii]|nr:MAG: hypothetical protein LQ343_005450 [Gyalolechia ehrenbergii]
MGKDLDSQWVHLLARNRRNINGSTLSKASPYTGDRKHARSHSSATSYFALLSASGHGSNAGRTFANHQKHGNVPGITIRDMDSSWVAWFTERWQERQLVDDMPVKTMQEQGEQPFLDIPETLPHPETRRMQMQRNNLTQDQEDLLGFNHTTPPTSAISSSSAGTASPLPSPPNAQLDIDIDGLDTFNELLSNFCTATSLPPIPALANRSSAGVPTTVLDDGDFTWLEEQPNTFPIHMSDESGVSSPVSKRSREEYHGDYTTDGQHQREIVTSKKQKVLHPKTDWFDLPSPDVFGVSRSVYG